MSLNYLPLDVYAADWNCPVCMEAILLEQSLYDRSKLESGEQKKGDVAVIHSGDNGAQHPYHASCLLKWLEQAQKCPTCRAPTAFTDYLPMALDQERGSYQQITDKQTIERWHQLWNNETGFGSSHHITGVITLFRLRPIWFFLMRFLFLPTRFVFFPAFIIFELHRLLGRASGSLQRSL
jgi:hypothetical protein